tara:strand:+ start:546 stop:2120 length:1575 start_codon:yes stop_codon:yes gene_type:complete
MNVCKHPNNIDKVDAKVCNGNHKYNICYGEGTKYPTLEDLDHYINSLEKDATKYEEISNLYTTGCWENKSNKPFIKSFNKIDEKDPVKCLTNGNKWITGDGYIINKKEKTSNLKKNTSSKIIVECSPGYEGEPYIEVDSCKEYDKFKDGDEGEYQQFLLSGCDKCSVKYGGNRKVKDDRSCYPQCGLLGTEVFDDSNSNKGLRFIDTTSDFTFGDKRAGYCCNHVNNSVSIKRVKGTEKPKGSNYLECIVNKCKEGYIRDNTRKNCCKMIENSLVDVEYSCDINSINTEPIDKEVNFCKEGFHPSMDENGYLCKKCDKIEGIHEQAKTTCDINGTNIKIDPQSEYKCQEGESIYYDELNQVCGKCPYNKKVNPKYNNNDNNSEKCICKSDYVINDKCFNCNGENVEYNEKFPDNHIERCKCVIDESIKLPENVLIGDCGDKPLYNGESCNLTCKTGYRLKGEQPRCLEKSLDKGTITCIKEDSNEDTEESTETEGFINMFNKFQMNTKRLFLIFLLIILILNVC